ncbi:hypothetical protein [Streptomyces mangrovisoli]|uniref:Uncharacterized protein n=1 Tax=Streptomyces mangrovisoli TaxID=1428628 RepID=A0A1J4NUH1_9ACTN|nr:hypothetical protein [Streptomyces mangrovisoli]OIJ65164.1 hypothetical protein WN71_025495 [Streptomyces mangrovisoli]
MEQRIGSSSQPLGGAGFDPAFIPGLTAPVSAEPEGSEDTEQPADEADLEAKSVEGEPSAEDASDGSAEDAADEGSGKPADDETGDDASAADDASDEDASDEDASDEDASDEDASDADEESDGPAFEAADRRARIEADATGVRLRLDDQACEFRWDEIGAVETEAPRFGKRYTITVHTPDNRWYPIEIEAATRARFKEWDAQLDAVLDAYFEE